MPDISRSSVDLPAPLCPTSATRSPRRSDSVMSRSASMIGTFESVPIRPPARPSTAFFSERVLASKIGKSTAASTMSMRGSGVPSVTSLRPSTRRGSGSCAGRPATTAQPTTVITPTTTQCRQTIGLAEQRLAQDLDEVHHRVQLDVRPPAGSCLQPLVGPHDRRHEEQQLREAGDDRRDVPEPRGDDAGEHARPTAPLSTSSTNAGTASSTDHAQRLREDDHQQQPDHEVVQRRTASAATPAGRRAGSAARAGTGSGPRSR